MARSRMVQSFKKKAFSGSLWMAGVSFGQQIVQFAVQIVLARLLLPRDYGVAALVMTIGSFAVVFSSAGIGAALVQRKDLTRDMIDASAVITAGLACALGLAIFCLSDFASRFYEISELSFLLKIVGLDVFLKVMISLYDSLMLREMMFRAAAVRNLAGLLLQAAVSVLLASRGFGAKALVYGYISGSAAQLALCVAATRYLPRSFGTFGRVGGIFRFGAWVLGGKIANQLAMVLDQMIIARVLNVNLLGLFNVSKTLTGIVPNTLVGFVGRIALPLFSRWQDDRARLESAYQRGLRVNMMVVFPICLVVGLFSYQILSLLYGPKWIDGAGLMRILAVSVAIASIDAGYTASAFNATGNPQCITYILLLSLPLFPLCIWIGSFWGVVGVVWSLVASSLLFLGVNLFLIRLRLGFKVMRVFDHVGKVLLTLAPAAATGAALLNLNVLPAGVPPKVLSVDWFVLGLSTAFCAFLCLALCALFARIFMKDDFLFLWNGVKGVLKR